MKKNVMVLFDCDGVLINTEEIGYKIMQGMFAHYNISYTREEYVELLSGITYGEFHRVLRERHPQLPPGFQAEVSRLLKEAEETQMKALDGVRTLLKNLRDNGIPYAVCSNSGADNLLWKLKKSGLYDDFAPHIFSRHHVENPKPAPDMYLHAAALRGVKPENCLVVEDSMTGTMAGLAAGMTVIGYVGEAHRDTVEAQMLAKAGAKLIAMDHWQTWEHVRRFAGIAATPAFAPALT